MALVTVSAGLIAAIVLYLVFRRRPGSALTAGQALVEASRRDALTGTPNHGALVESLATEIEQARIDDSAIGVALIDLDDFRLLNDNYGHEAGDRGPPAVVEALARGQPPDITCGRYGPDEFLLVSAADRTRRWSRRWNGSARSLVDLRSSSHATRAAAGDRQRRGVASTPITAHR